MSKKMRIDDYKCYWNFLYIHTYILVICGCSRQALMCAVLLNEYQNNLFSLSSYSNVTLYLNVMVTYSSITCVVYMVLYIISIIDEVHSELQEAKLTPWCGWRAWWDLGMIVAFSSVNLPNVFFIIKVPCNAYVITPYY